MFASLGSRCPSSGLETPYGTRAAPRIPSLLRETCRSQCLVKRDSADAARTNAAAAIAGARTRLTVEQTRVTASCSRCAAGAGNIWPPAAEAHVDAGVGVSGHLRAARVAEQHSVRRD